ncbi:hypothetical protein JG687_00011960, partial [Phytophthora cactorum]
YVSREEQDRAEQRDTVRGRRNRDTATPLAEGPSVAVPVFTGADAVVSTWCTLVDVRRAVLSFFGNELRLHRSSGHQTTGVSQPVSNTTSGANL